MKKSLTTPVLGVLAALAVIALVVVFVRMTGDPAPTATDVPDYSKMTPAEVTEAYGKTKQAESDALKARR